MRKKNRTKYNIVKAKVGYTATATHYGQDGKELETVSAIVNQTRFEEIQLQEFLAEKMNDEDFDKATDMLDSLLTEKWSEAHDDGFQSGVDQSQGF